MKFRDYDKDNDILSVHWGNKTLYSVEMFDGELIIDFDKNDDVVGMEIFGFMEQIRKHDKKMEEISKKKTWKK